MIIHLTQPGENKFGSESVYVVLISYMLESKTFDYILEQRDGCRDDIRYQKSGIDCAERIDLFQRLSTEPITITFGSEIAFILETTSPPGFLAHLFAISTRIQCVRPP